MQIVKFCVDLYSAFHLFYFFCKKVQLDLYVWFYGFDPKKLGGGNKKVYFFKTFLDQIHKNTPTDPTELFCKKIEKVKRRIQIHTKLHNFHRFYTKMTLNQILFRHDSKHSNIILFFWLFLKIIIMCSVLCRFPQILIKICIFWIYLISCLYTSHQTWWFL